MSKIEIKSTLLLFQLQVPKERFGKERKKAKKRKTSMGERTTDMYDPSSREDSISMFPSDNKGTLPPKSLPIPISVYVIKHAC